MKLVHDLIAIQCELERSFLLRALLVVFSDFFHRFPIILLRHNIKLKIIFLFIIIYFLLVAIYFCGAGESRIIVENAIVYLKIIDLLLAKDCHRQLLLDNGLVAQINRVKT